MQQPVPLIWLRDQVAHARTVRRDHGWRAVVGDRIAAALRSSPAWLAEARSRQHETAVASAATRADIEELRRNVTDLATTLAAARQSTTSLEHNVDAMRAMLDDTRLAFDQWFWWANAPLPQHPLVTVIMPTAHAERSDYLRAAVDSVLAQSYVNWELLVVDDTPATTWIEDLPEWWPVDQRVTIIPSGGSGQAHARNLGLDAASGKIVAYLDDDCRWFPWWLHALVATFSDPDVDAAYGVRVIEETGGSSGSFVRHLDPLELHRANPADTNVVAHRAGLPMARWSSTLTTCADYQLAVDLSELTWRFVPVPAATYATSAPHRFWAKHRVEANLNDQTEVARRARRKRPLRIVAHNGLYPQMSETYIGDELEALRRCDVDIVLSRVEPACVPTQQRLDVPLYGSLAEAIEAHDPDLVLAHWAGVALDARSTCVEAAVPYGVRTHSFDRGIVPEQLIDHWCIGTWNPPSFDLSHPRQFPLPTLIVDPPADTFTDDRVRSVLSVSAGLPKKAWPTLMDAMTNLSATPLEVIVAETNGFEWIPAHIVACANERNLSPVIRTNVRFDDVQHALRTHGVLVYSSNPGVHLGQPRSIIEGAIAGIPLVVPNDPAMRLLVGDCAHFYERGDADSLATALDAALTTPHSARNRLDMADRIRAAHSSAAAFEDWAISLTDALLRWRSETRRDLDGRLIRWWNTFS